MEQSSGAADSSVEPSGPSRKRRRLLEYRVCPHCKNMLNHKKFQEHRRLFYDSATKVWTKEMITDTSDSDIEFSEFEDVIPNQETAATPEPESDWDSIFEEQDPVNQLQEAANSQPQDAEDEGMF